MTKKNKKYCKNEIRDEGVGKEVNRASEWCLVL